MLTVSRWLYLHKKKKEKRKGKYVKCGDEKRCNAPRFNKQTFLFLKWSNRSE